MRSATSWAALLSTYTLVRSSGYIAGRDTRSLTLHTCAGAGAAECCDFKIGSSDDLRSCFGGAIEENRGIGGAIEGASMTLLY
jgi:hypothetical protein